MTTQEAIETAMAELSSMSESATLDAQLLVCHARNIEQTKLVAHPEQELSNEEQALFKSTLARRSQGEPLAYIVGEKEFWSLAFIVNRHVLIPRPETELLVEIVLDTISEKQSPHILDLGTGSGAIAISIAKERMDCTFVATDISEASLGVAKLNAAKHGVEITFTHSDWYQNIHKEKFDAIVCNPPYVAEDDPYLQKYVTEYEPRQAVISKINGLRDLEQVISGAHGYLSSRGNLLIEHGFQQALEVQHLFNKYGFNQIRTYKDWAGLNRVTSGDL